MKSDAVGIVKGLAWTAVGGVTLDVEACIMDGKGEITLTGQLGDVMKESAIVALGYIRSKASEYGIDKELFEIKISIYTFRRARCQKTGHPQELQ